MRLLWRYLFLPLLFVAPLSPIHAVSQLEPYRTDACSAPMGLAADSWTLCCTKHDVSYWIGGSLQDKQRADTQLMNCLRTKGVSGQIAAEVFERAPKHFSEARWGSRWHPRRPNKPLSPEEWEQVKKHQSAFSLPSPIVEDPAGYPCSEQVTAAVELNARIAKKTKLTCFALKSSDVTVIIPEELVYSTSCSGYFIVQKNGLFQDPNLVVGYGGCAKTIYHPERRFALLQHLKCLMLRPQIRDFYELVRNRM